MNADAREQTVAVVGDRSAATDALREFLAARDISAPKWFSPNDLDDVERAIQEGMIHRVVFPAWDSLLDGVWSELIDLERWFNAGVHIDFVEGASDRDAQLITLAANWRRHQHRRRYRRAVAGTVLSAIALAAAFVLIWRSA